jgi:hypothetical protein
MADNMVFIWNFFVLRPTVLNAFAGTGNPPHWVSIIFLIIFNAMCVMQNSHVACLSELQHRFTKSLFLMNNFFFSFTRGACGTPTLNNLLRREESCFSRSVQAASRTTAEA